MSGYAIAFACGQLISMAHNILPFMLLGIGVDDLFVIVSCIEQMPMHLSANERFKKGLAHAGPSITITSVTDALAFFLGSFTTLPALRSFCIFAGICTITLYFSFLTIFSPYFINDLRKMHRRKGDCCGLCCCKEDTFICCYARFLSKKQRVFSKLAFVYDMKPSQLEKKKSEAGSPVSVSTIDKKQSDISSLRSDQNGSAGTASSPITKESPASLRR